MSCQTVQSFMTLSDLQSTFCNSFRILFLSQVTFLLELLITCSDWLLINVMNMHCMFVCRCIDISPASQHINFDTNRPGRCAATSHRRCLQTDLILTRHHHILCGDDVVKFCCIAGVFY